MVYVVNQTGVVPQVSPYPVVPIQIKKYPALSSPITVSTSAPFGFNFSGADVILQLPVTRTYSYSFFLVFVQIHFSATAPTDSTGLQAIVGNTYSTDYFGSAIEDCPAVTSTSLENAKILSMCVMLTPNMVSASSTVQLGLALTPDASTNPAPYSAIISTSNFEFTVWECVTPSMSGLISAAYSYQSNPYGGTVTVSSAYTDGSQQWGAMSAAPEQNKALIKINPSSVIFARTLSNFLGLNGGTGYMASVSLYPESGNNVPPVADTYPSFNMTTGFTNNGSSFPSGGYTSIMLENVFTFNDYSGVYVPGNSASTLFFAASALPASSCQYWYGSFSSTVCLELLITNAIGFLQIIPPSIYYYASVGNYISVMNPTLAQIGAQYYNPLVITPISANSTLIISGNIWTVPNSFTESTTLLYCFYVNIGEQANQSIPPVASFRISTAQTNLAQNSKGFHFSFSVPSLGAYTQFAVSIGVARADSAMSGTETISITWTPTVIEMQL